MPPFPAMPFSARPALLRAACVAGIATPVSAWAARSSNGASCRHLSRSSLRCEAATAVPLAPMRRTAAASSSGVTSGTEIRYFTSRSHDVATTASYHAVAAAVHQFLIVDGVCGEDGGAECARFCAQRLPTVVTRQFEAYVEQKPLWSRTTSATGEELNIEQAAGGGWADALTTGFKFCDGMAQKEVTGGCIAVHAVVARSGVYIGSVGLGRAVMGTEDNNDIICDEVTNVHNAQNSTEKDRLGDMAKRVGGPTRLLGGKAEKEVIPQLIPGPDVVRLQHAPRRRFLLIGSPGIWEFGPRLPLQWAVQAFNTGQNPAEELIARTMGDSVAVVLVLPETLFGDGLEALPPHEESRSQT